MSDLSIKEILKSINKKFGDEIIKIGVDPQKEVKTLSLGSPGLDFCLYNSFPTNKIVEFSGGEGAGKSTASFLTAASFQKQELKDNPNNPRSILFVDLEHSLDPTWTLKAGYDTQNHPVKTIYFAPEDQSAEDILDIILDFIKTGEIGLVILDSLNMLVPQQVYDKSLETKEMGTTAKVLGDFVRRVKGLLVKYNCVFIGINQLRENIGGYGNPLQTSGGRGWKHGCDVRLMFKKAKFYDSDMNELSTNAESPAAYEMQCAVLKTKVCKWDRKLGRTIISYDRGVDILQDTIDVAIMLGLIDNSTQGSFKLIDPETGEILTDTEGNELKIRGKKNLRPYFESHIDLWRKLYDSIYEKISKKEDPNIISFEQMLNINVQETFDIDLKKEEE